MNSGPNPTTREVLEESSKWMKSVLGKLQSGNISPEDIQKYLEWAGAIDQKMSKLPSPKIQ